MPASRWLSLTLVATVVACGGAAPSTRTGGGGETAVDEKDAAKAARAHVQEIYDELRRGNVGSVQSLLAPEVFVVGPGAADVFTSRSDAVVALAGFLREGDRHKLSSRALKVSSAPSGHSAWASDLVEVDGVTCTVTAVLAETDGLWTVVALHVGRVLSERQLPSKPPERAPLPGGTSAGAADAVRLYRAGVAAPARFVEQLGKGNDLLMLGTGPKEQTRGEKAIKKLWKKRLAAQPKLKLEGEPRADVTADKELAWVFANVDVASATAPPEPYRSLVIYEKGEGGWNLVAMHDSVAVSTK
jgi:SnoaL-like domain